MHGLKMTRITLSEAQSLIDGGYSGESAWMTITKNNPNHVNPTSILSMPTQLKFLCARPSSELERPHGPKPRPEIFTADVRVPTLSVHAPQMPTANGYDKFKGLKRMDAMYTDHIGMNFGAINPFVMKTTLIASEIGSQYLRMLPRDIVCDESSLRLLSYGQHDSTINRERFKRSQNHLRAEEPNS